MISEENKLWANEVLQKIRKKMEWVSEKNKYKIPYTTDENGDYNDLSDGGEYPIDRGINWWTNGFWGGLMWLMYQDTNKESYKEVAEICEKKLEECFQIYFGLHHDVGFMYQLTSVANYELTKNETARKNAMHAANLLAGRFNPAGQFIRAWNDNDDFSTKGWAIIDCMLNISLLFWATRESGDPRFAHIAKIYSDKVARSFIREDGSSCHIVEFDVNNGDIIKTYGGQGLQEGSAWTRGQGWAIYGFTNTYIHTKDEKYLEVAKKVANYCLSQIDESGIIPIDFHQPKDEKLEDCCGAVIIASGLIELAKYTSGTEKDEYLNCALKILKTIDTERSIWDNSCDAIVQNCSSSYHNLEGRHIAMVYADYFFVEAILKLNNIGRFMW